MIRNDKFEVNKQEFKYHFIRIELKIKPNFIFHFFFQVTRHMNKNFPFKRIRKCLNLNQLQTVLPKRRVRITKLRKRRIAMRKKITGQ